MRCGTFTLVTSVYKLKIIIRSVKFRKSKLFCSKMREICSHFSIVWYRWGSCGINGSRLTGYFIRNLPWSVPLSRHSMFRFILHLYHVPFFLAAWNNFLMTLSPKSSLLGVLNKCNFLRSWVKFYNIRTLKYIHEKHTVRRWKRNHLGCSGRIGDVHWEDSCQCVQPLSR